MPNDLVGVHRSGALDVGLQYRAARIDGEVRMAEVAVFVDDAVRGRLPDICTKDGVPARGRLRVVEEIGRPHRIGILWLLLFLGPVGWIVLLVLASRNSGERLAVVLPYSDAAYERFSRARTRRNLALAVGAIGGVGLVLVTAWAQLGPAGYVLAAGVVGAASVALMIAEYRLGAASVGVRLDASRRWVTLQSVHPAFARSYHEQQQQQATTRV